ncbi:MAG: hypothetical protein GX536_01135 [Actinobacteria bacterium]|nr:hypothetical protein [Actinomycetota bacterium]OPZ78464.1 MAG: hypothetical protein BWY79_00764 [Actinobacteria bacterium ADurb.Bin444]
MKLAKLVAAVAAIAGVVVLVLSILNRDGGALWMPFAFFLGLLLELIAVVFATYDDSEAVEARERLKEAA